MFEYYRYCALMGLSGVGKSLLVDDLLAQGEQVLSIEHLLEIRGICLKNIFDTVDIEPAVFDETLMRAFARFDRGRVVHIEWKPPEIFGIALPPGLIASVRLGACRLLSCPMEERITRLVEQYGAWHEHQEVIVAMLSPRLSEQQHERLSKTVGCDVRVFVEVLLRDYFDPLYEAEMAKFLGRSGSR